MRASVVMLIAAVAVLGCAQERAEEVSAGVKEDVMSQSASGFRLLCPGFEHESPIPPRFTADGADVSPPLRLVEPPEGVASFALIMDDPDAPVGTWVHWVVWNIPAGVSELAEGALPEGAVSGRNSWGRTGYGGPAPPSGTHRYFFKLYALDGDLELDERATKQHLEKAIEGHVLAQATLMGTYTRKR